jgi:hypothetical protein
MGSIKRGFAAGRAYSSFVVLVEITSACPQKWTERVRPYENLPLSEAYELLLKNVPRETPAYAALLATTKIKGHSSVVFDQFCIKCSDVDADMYLAAAEEFSPSAFQRLKCGRRRLLLISLVDPSAQGPAKLESGFLHARLVSIMELRNHPLVSYRGRAAWPPIWVGAAGIVSGKKALGEVGSIKEVR